MKYIQILFLVAYLFSGYVYSVNVIDKISFQWMYLCILNIIVLFFLKFVDRSNEVHKNNFYKSKLTITFLTFVLIGLSSYLYAINQNEVIINFLRWFNIFVAFGNIYFILIKLRDPRRILSLVLSFGFVIELVISLLQIYSLSEFKVLDFNISSQILGMASNKNINAASLVTKLPFILYLTYKTDKEVIKFSSLILIFLTAVVLNFIGSRASFVSLTLLFVLILIFFTYRGFKQKNLWHQLVKYSLPTLLTFGLGFLITSLYLGANNSSTVINRISTINLNDQSTSLRLSYYKQALNHFLENPIIGVGLGNWKVKSIDYDNINMISYTVQYHAHNDFLQFSAELGLFGLLTYLGIFLFCLIYNIKNIFSDNNENSFFSFIMILSLGAYFIDSNLNFPYARVINLIVFIFIISGSLIQKSLKYEK